MLIFEEMGKPEYPEKNLSEQSREPTNSVRARRQFSWKFVLSPTSFPGSLIFRKNHLGGDYLSNRPQVSMGYLQVNALSERIIRIYLHEFTNNERENSIPHEAAECGIENFEFIVSERVQVNPDNSRAMSALTFLLFKLNTLQTKIVKLWVSRSHGVMTVVYWIYTTAITPR